MDTAPFDTRVLVRDGRGITIGQRAAIFGPDGSWADDYATPVIPGGWLPLPDVDECETIELGPVRMSIGEVGQASCQ